MRLDASASLTPLMRIGIDARELCGKPTGVGRHLLGLLKHWTLMPAASRHTFLLYAHEPPSVNIPAVGTLRVLPGTSGTWWEQFQLARAASADDLDVLLAPGYTAPQALGRPVVVIIHDLSFVAHPEWFRAREGLRRRWFTRLSARRARLVLTVSEFSRGEIVGRLGIPPTRVLHIRPGVEDVAAALPAPPAPLREPLVLFVGSIFNRRHVPDLIRAFARLSTQSPEARLEIVGEDRSYPPQDLGALIVKEGLAGRVSLRSFVSDIVLADLYRHARVFAFLSEYEGFGHPPLEALAVGVPSVMLDTPVARETCGEAALYVARADVDGVSTALRCLLFDDSVRARILDRAPDVLRQYSWKEAARETLAVLERAAGTAL